MTTYTLHFTDPHTSPFVINPYTINGLKSPILNQLESGAASARTSLLCYGKGRPEYGERIQENIINLMEHFAGATTPANPVAGQLWFDRRTFFHGNAAANLNWYVWADDPTDPNGGAWNTLTLDPVPTPAIIADAYTTGSGAPSGIPDYQYYVDSSASPFALYEYVSTTGHPLENQWIERGYMEETSTGAPSASTIKPQQRLMVQNYVRTSQVDDSNWVDTQKPWASPVPPVDPENGTLWYDTTGSPSGSLKVYNGSSFDTLAIGTSSTYVNISGDTMTGILYLNATPALGDNSLRAASTAYVDAAVLAGIGIASLDALSDVDTITNPPSNRQVLTYIGTGSPQQWENSTLLLTDIPSITADITEVNFLSGVSGLIQAQLNARLDKSGGTMTGALVLSGAPTIALHAATKQYVDDSDRFVSAGSYDYATGTITLTVTNSGTVPVAIDPYITVSDELLSALPIPPTLKSEAIHDLDHIVRRRTTPRRTVTPASGGSPLIFTTPPYEVESHKLFVFDGGLKSIASTRGYQSVSFTLVPLGSPWTPAQLGCDVDTGLPLGSPVITYESSITIDGGSAQPITIVADSVDATSFCTLVDAINTQLTGGYAVLEDAAIVVYSDTVGSGSSVLITDGTGSPPQPLFSSLSYFNAIDAAEAGADYAYEEVGTPGTTSTSVVFNGAITGPNLEFIVMGEIGTP